MRLKGRQQSLGCCNVTQLAQTWGKKVIKALARVSRVALPQGAVVEQSTVLLVKRLKSPR